jgi:hypothetical protein
MAEVTIKYLDEPDSTYAEKSESKPKTTVVALDEPTQSTTDYSDIAKDLNVLQKLGIGIGRGFHNAGTGVAQNALKLGNFISPNFVPDASLKLIEQDIEKERQMFKPLGDSTAFNIGEFLGNLAPAAAIPGGMAGGALTRMGTAALSGVGQAALQPTTKDETFLNNAIRNAVMGSAGSGLLSGGSKLINTGLDVNRGLNSLTGTAIESLETPMQKYGRVPTTWGERSQSPYLQKIESIADGFPAIFGNEKFRRFQNQQADDHAKNVLSEYIVNPAGDSTAAWKEGNKAFLDKMYKDLEPVMKDLDPIIPQNSKKVIGEIFENYKGILSDKNIQNTKVLRFARALNKGTEEPIDAMTLWKVRQALGEEIGSTNNKIVKGQLKYLYGAISKDIDGLAINSGKPEVGQLFKDYNDSYVKYSVKFDALRKAFDASTGVTKAGGTNPLFHPDVFANTLSKLANDPAFKPNIKWKPGEIENLTGASNILWTAKQSGKFMDNPATGARFGLAQGVTSVGASVAGTGGAYMAGADPMVAMAIGTGATVASTMMMKFLTTHPFGIKLAMSASKLQPNDPKMKLIVGLAERVAQKSLPTAMYLREGGN